MAKTKHQTENSKICAAVLQVAAQKGWDGVTLEAVAKSVKISIALFKQRFSSKPGLIPVVIEEIDRQAIAASKPAATPHDTLFDLLMARFDILQKNRAAILSIAEAARRDRALSCVVVGAAGASANRFAEAVKFDAPPRPVLAAGIIAVYAWAFLAWRRDESRDMAKTMSALDRALRLAGKAAGLLKRQ